MPTQTPAPAAIDLADKLAQFADTWAPKVIARMNDYEVKVVKLDGEFVWHSHADTDELFLVLSGNLTIRLRGGSGDGSGTPGGSGEVTLGPGQLYVVPRGVEHCPVTDGLVQAVLIEPSGVVNTGDAGGALTARHDDSLA